MCCVQCNAMPKQRDEYKSQLRRGAARGDISMAAAVFSVVVNVSCQTVICTDISIIHVEERTQVHRFQIKKKKKNEKAETVKGNRKYHDALCLFTRVDIIPFQFTLY